MFQELNQCGCWDLLLGSKSQTAAAWAYTIATAVLLYYVIRQVKHAESQIRHVENQLSEMRAARDLESFVVFIRIWDDSEVRAARQRVYALFGPALKKKDPLEKQTEFEKVIGGVAGQQHDASIL